MTDSAVLADAAVAADIPLADTNPLSEVVTSTVNALIAASRERVREAERDQSWQRPPRESVDPIEIASQLERDYGHEIEQHRAGHDNITGLTVLLLLELCHAVGDEDGQEGGLAAAIASVDVARISNTTDHYIELLDAIVSLGAYSLNSTA